MEQRKEINIEGTVKVLKEIYKQTSEAKSKARLKEDKNVLDDFLKNIDFIVELLENPIFENDDVNSEIERKTEETIAICIIQTWFTRRIIDEHCN